MRKFIIFFVSLSISFILNAQIINFTDSNFKNALINYPNNLDTNGDGEIEISEVDNVTSINVHFKFISAMPEISYFINLEQLICTNNQLTLLDVSSNPNLISLNCGNNQINQLLFNNNNQLITLDAHNNNLMTIDLSGLNNIETLYLNNNNLQNLDVSNLSNLLNLSCGDNNLTELDLGGLSNIETLDLNNNNLQNLDVSNLSNLWNLSCGDNNLTELDLSNNTSLVVFNAENNQILSINASGLPNLTFWYFPYNNTQYINVRGTDFPNSEDDEGTNWEIFYGFIDGNNYKMICCDPEDLIFYSDLLSSNGITDCYINTHEDCTFYQSEIKMRYDIDGNGCSDQDSLIHDFSISLNGTNDNSDFQFYQSGTTPHYIYTVDSIVTITPSLAGPYFNIIPDSMVIDYTSTNTGPFEFCITASQPAIDLEITLIPISNFAVPNTHVNYKMVYKNIGNTVMSDDVTLIFQDDYMDLTDSEPTPDFQASNILRWNFTNLLPFEEREIFFTLYLNPPTHPTFPLNIGDFIDFSAIIEPVTTDVNPVNNIFSLSQECAASYDPNDIILLEGASLAPEEVGTFVHYRIRFENIGNAPALNVIIEDPIDINALDLSTVQVVDASHSVRTIIEDNMLKFEFININLLFDDANNDGFVVFKIKTLETLQLGDSFSNQASIFFDANEPIITNNYTTTIEALKVDELDTSNEFVIISPNPAKDFFTLESHDEILKVEIIDANGRLLNSYLGNQAQYSVSHLHSGVYLLRIHGHDNVLTEKLIIE